MDRSPAGSGSVLRGIVSRHRTLALFTATAAALGAGIRYQAGAMRRNEAVQQRYGPSSAGADGGRLYVSVERSGGGV